MVCSKNCTRLADVPSSGVRDRTREDGLISILSASPSGYRCQFISRFGSKKIAQYLRPHSRSVASISGVRLVIGKWPLHHERTTAADKTGRVCQHCEQSFRGHGSLLQLLVHASNQSGGLKRLCDGY